ncbi:MAG: hypothetical protein JWP26_3669 [Devosia sp.]|uniref:hypothetical protein n=1 Tax=Devosia sp. TaxID=1871048 RepID=UPI00262148A8|nr:hypothetical protein [Devosia sp.]MDB5588699.1 hypothetical protein [Devosia sp.]
MTAVQAPKIFFQFADSVVDPAPDYDSSDEERVLWGISAFGGPGRTNSLGELKLCLEDMLARLSDDELNQLWSKSHAMIKYRDPSLARAILQTAVSTIATELKDSK